jgi:8-oxo-dGTP pyrophosphatase MutT (NUDIX family)
MLSEISLREPLRRHLATRAPRLASPTSGTASAVLIALFTRDEDTHVWLVRRSDGLRRHSGQVALPGGKRDPSDASGLHTALREAEEEIGLPATSLDVLGQLDDLVTGTGFTISPFVAWVTQPFTPRPNVAEVARVFDVPLRTFFAKARGIPPFHGYSVEGELVWGATGKILRDLVAAVREAVPTS